MTQTYRPCPDNITGQAEAFANAAEETGQSMIGFMELYMPLFDPEMDLSADADSDELRLTYAANTGSHYIAVEEATRIVNNINRTRKLFLEFVDAVDDELDRVKEFIKGTGVDVSDINSVNNDKELDELHQKFPELNPGNMSTDEMVDMLRRAFAGSEFGVVGVVDGETDEVKELLMRDPGPDGVFGTDDDVDHDVLGSAANEGYPHYD